MLQQTRVEAVKPYFARFMECFPTVQALAECEEEELFKYWEGLGYYSRARNLKKAAKIIVSQYGGELPADRRALLALPGIGSYTAGAIGSIAFGLPVPAVDGNVMRVLSRVAGSYEDILKQAVKKKTEAAVEEVLKTLKKDEPGDFNQALIETGAIVCVPNGAPLCDLPCPFYTVCEARKRNLISAIPVKAPKKKMCFASGSFSSTDAPPPRRSSTSFSESFPSRFGNSYRDASSPVSSRFLMAILSPYFTNNTVFSSIFLFFFGAFTGIAEIRFLFLASHTV
jgi:A/G-specific adenine glycosylase